MRLIDADAAIREATKEGAFGYISVAEINKLPTIEARKTGEWVGINEYLSHLREETGEFYKVSNLYDATPWCNSCWHSNDQKTNFCPHCGAVMHIKHYG